ncbi:MAG: DegV family protein [Lachnospiraceae bacterium]|nr:DegV family protein [Lachnospiraceae bacterium]
MSRTAIITDSNSGITQSEAKKLGILVQPMPFMINGKEYFEDIDLTQEEFYDLLYEGAQISTSMPEPGKVTALWDQALKDYDEVVYIPMSSGLSSSCATAMMLANDYGGKVQVVDNQRISVTQRQSVLDAMSLAAQGKGAAEIRYRLLSEKMESSIYIMVDTLTYLKRGGRITPAAAALGTMLRLKPVLQIQGERLDAYAKARNVKKAKAIMLEAMMQDFKERFKDPKGKNIHLELAYSKDREPAERWREEIIKEYGEREIVVQPLSLSVACHIGPGALAIACSHAI